MGEAVPVNEVVLRVLGDCYVSVNGRVVYPTSNFLRLVVFIVLEGKGRVVNRPHLARLHWGHGNQRQNNTDFRQALARVRRFQADQNFRAIEWDACNLWLSDADRVYIDLEELLGVFSVAGSASWARVCEIYAGDMLEGYALAGHEFEEWLDYQRFSLHEVFVTYISQTLLPGSSLTHDERMFCARRLLDLEPSHEAAHRALMFEAAVKGEVGMLRRAFERCAALLLRELGVPPSSETVKYYESLMEECQTDRKFGNSFPRKNRRGPLYLHSEPGKPAWARLRRRFRPLCSGWARLGIGGWKNVY